MKRTVRVGLLVLCSALVASATAIDYYWNSGGVDDEWETSGNWLVFCCPNTDYPEDGNDNAIFIYHSGGWGDVVLTQARTVNDLTLKGDVDFTDSGGPWILDADDAVFDAASVSSGQYLTVTVSGDVTVRTYENE